MNFKTISSKTLFRGRVFSLRTDVMQAPDGREFEIDLVDHAGAVTIIPIDADGQFWLVRQYRHAAGRQLLEFPAGVMDPHEPPHVSAQRELREETGVAAETLVPLGEFFLAPGYSTEYMYIFLATGLTPAPLQPDDFEYIQIEKYSGQQVGELVKNGQIQDAKSLAALYLWQAWQNSQSEG